MLKITDTKLPILVWAEEADLEGYDEALAQARNLANHPLARKQVALMPDFHVGYGMPIGGVFATKGGVLPNAVGVDIGCGMIAARTTLEADSLDRDTLQVIRQGIHARVPVGNGPGGQHKEPQHEAEATDHPVISHLLDTAGRQLGTLGGGNHFIELQRDEEGRVWLMLHSGSRAIGAQVCNYYDDVAKGGHPRMVKGRAEIDRKEQKPLAREDELAFLLDSWPTYNEYIEAMNWCLRFAEENRHLMLQATMAAIIDVLRPASWSIDEPIETHHNYAAMETHMGEELLVHRKGAVRAFGKVIIPGSMGTASYIALGKASVPAFHSCSHGAGRVLGRNQANRTITKEQAVESMKHVVFGVRDGDYEEMPAAYKDIDRVIANQHDLIEPLHRLTPLAVVKG